MQYAILRKVLAVLIGLALTATGLWASGEEEESAAATEKEMVLDPSTGRMVTAPEYGGTLTWPTTVFPPSSDNWWNLGWAMHFISGVNEKMAHINWAVSRDIWDGTQSDRPEVSKGNLAESWSMPDDTTFIWNIRQGVHWHDKEPMNGRQLDAHDIVWNYHRYLGMGDFTEDGPNAAVSAITMGLDIESVTATDDWTVEIKLAKPGFDVLGKMLRNYYYVHAPEQIEQFGDAKDWKTLVGTGPLMLVDYVEGSSATWEKNPNYWGFDEKFPDNRLPYFDQIRALIMPETTTYLSALRTGQIDYVGPISASQLRSMDQLESLQRTNPELKVHPFANRSDNAVGMNIQVEPFDDIRIRKAMQMALNLEEINQGFFGGFADTIPQGAESRLNATVATPFAEWPADVKKAFEYDPAGAEALLDEAGYPRGADGVRFKTEFMHLARYDLNYTELLISYWDAIGVKVEADVQPLAEFVARRQDRRFVMINAEAAFKGEPVNPVKRFIPSTSWNSANVDDEWYNAKFAEALAATTLEERDAALGELNMYGIEQFWHLAGPVGPQFSLTQPWVVGFNGEGSLGNAMGSLVLASLWFDSSLKP